MNRRAALVVLGALATTMVATGGTPAAGVASPADVASPGADVASPAADVALSTAVAGSDGATGETQTGSGDQTVTATPSTPPDDLTARAFLANRSPDLVRVEVDPGGDVATITIRYRFDLVDPEREARFHAATDGGTNLGAIQRAALVLLEDGHPTSISTLSKGGDTYVSDDVAEVTIELQTDDYLLSAGCSGARVPAVFDDRVPAPDRYLVHVPETFETVRHVGGAEPSEQTGSAYVWSDATGDLELFRGSTPAPETCVDSGGGSVSPPDGRTLAIGAVVVFSWLLVAWYYVSGWQSSRGGHR